MPILYTVPDFRIRKTAAHVHLDVCLMCVAERERNDGFIVMSACRESLYRLLPQTTPENITKNFEQYTIDPATRYPNLNSNCVRPHQVS